MGFASWWGWFPARCILRAEGGGGICKEGYLLKSPVELVEGGARFRRAIAQKSKEAMTRVEPVGDLGRRENPSIFVKAVSGKRVYCFSDVGAAGSVADSRALSKQPAV